MIITKCRIANLPYHPSPKIWHILLGEPERLLTPWKSFQELTSEYTTVKPILLLRCRLHSHRISQPALYVRSDEEKNNTNFWSPVFPICEIERLFPLVHVFGIDIRP